MSNTVLPTFATADGPSAERVRPGLLTHRGVVEASALLFDTHLLTPAVARGRVLALWTLGATVYRLEEGLLLRLPAPSRVVCAVAPGLPLVCEGGLLTAAPITVAERKRLPLLDGLLLVRNGEAVVTPLSESTREDPADWLDLSAWRPIDVVSLGAPPAPPVVVAEAAPFDARAKLHGVPPADPQSAAVAQKLQAALRAQREGKPSPAERLGEPRQSPVVNMLRPLLERLAHLGETPPGSSAGRNNRKGRGEAAPKQGLGVRPQSEREALNPFQSWLKHTAARALMMTGLARQIGQKQADYLGRMMEMFEKGELDAALRHAIPLGGDSGGAPAPPSLSIPSARENLQITSGTARGRLGMGVELFTDLRTLYRHAFEQLERQGRIEEAAFVLAELLHASAEAVAFLERHGKLQLAAEIAEARKLAPGLIVRQWLLAGDRDRAMLIARRHQAFGAAVELLNHKNPEQALELRRLWAQATADAGDYAAAVDLLWQHPDLRAETLPWILQALAFGGVPAARMLTRLLELTPEDSQLHTRIAALLDDEDPEQAPERKEFAEALCTVEVTPRATVFARAALRALIRDSLLAPHLMDRELFRRLQKVGADAALRADLPPLPAEATIEALNRRESPLALEWPAHDVGAMPLTDAAFLPNGRCLVALGEAGVRLLTRDGRTVAHFDQPAYRLVVADNGQRAIAIAPRGDVLRLARLDLAGLHSAHWCETTLQTFAPDYDGSLWFVATTGDLLTSGGRAGDLLAIDATADRFQALWRTPDLTGSPVQIARTILDCALLLRQPQVVEGLHGLPQLAETWWIWHFALPSLTMRDRLEQPPPDLRLAFTRGVAPSGATAELLVRKAAMLSAETSDEVRIEDDLLQLDVNATSRFTDSFSSEQAQPMQPILTATWVAVPFRFAKGVCVRLYDRSRGKHCATLTLLGASLLTVRLNDTHLTLADDRGRLIVLDLVTGNLTRNLRLH